jgi:hypothetical protein
MARVTAAKAHKPTQNEFENIKRSPYKYNSCIRYIRLRNYSREKASPAAIFFTFNIFFCGREKQYTLEKKPLRVYCRSAYPNIERKPPWDTTMMMM